jgi:DNA-binding beta-propeller fold protein YncE
MKAIIAVIALHISVAVAAADSAPSAPELDFTPVADVFQLPMGMNFGAVSGVAVNSTGNIFVLNRGPQPLMEFDADGKFIRAFGEGLFERPHGLRIDAQDNIWATDGGTHVVYKFNPQGRIVMVLGVKGSAGEWHPYGHLRLFNEPNDVAIGPGGDIYVTQGHGKGEPRVIKFDRDGKFLKTWGGKGTAPGVFADPHSIMVDSDGLVYVADRGNKRVQIFDADGTFVREWVYFGTPCGLVAGPGRSIYLANGHDGHIIKLDANGKILGMGGGQGKAPGRFGEAHFIALSPRGELYVSDTLNWRVQKYVKR